MVMSNLTWMAPAAKREPDFGKTTANKDWAPGNNERWDINGRLLLGFDGMRKMDNGRFAGFPSSRWPT